MKGEKQAAAPLRYAGRRGRVLSAVADSGLDGLLLTAPANVRYLAGFTGTNGWLLLTEEQAFLLTDPRYEQQACSESGDLSVVAVSTGLHQAVAEAVAASGIKRIGFEPDHVTVALMAKLEATVGAEWMETDGLVEARRRQKDPDELAALSAALAATEAALGEVADSLVPGASEIEIAAQLEGACRRRGAESMAFETIVASGPRSALPHGVASARRIEAGEPVMIDMGCKLDGYCSDLTRMIWCGDTPDRRWLELYDVVDRARAAAIAAIGPGAAAADVDEAAREVIVEAGYAEALRHGTGHGVGLEIHEAPKVSSRSADRLEAGMVLTVEPGAYVDGEFGIRIEDVVCVRNEGCERLTTLGTEPILRGIT